MKFKIGDKLKRISFSSGGDLRIGDIGRIIKVFDDVNTYRVINERNGFEQTWGESYVELVKTNKTITITEKKKSVIATITDGENSYTQFTKLSDANGDYKTAVKMVVERILDKFNPEKDNATDNPSFDWEGFKQGKFAVHCDTEEKAREFLKECDTHCIKWCSGSVPSSHTNFINYKENTAYRCDGRLDRLEFCYVEYFKNEGMHIIDFTPSKPTVKEVKRPAKVGEWVKVLSVDWFTDEDCKVGDIFKAVKPLCEVPQSDGAYYDEDVNGECKYISFGDYVVLENYQPEDKQLDSKPVQPFKKAKVGDKIKIVKDAGYHCTKIKIGDIHKVLHVKHDNVDTDKDNVFWDRDQEYIILEETKQNDEIKVGDTVKVIDYNNTCDLYRGFIKQYALNFIDKFSCGYTPENNDIGLVVGKGLHAFGGMYYAVLSNGKVFCIGEKGIDKVGAIK